MLRKITRIVNDVRGHALVARELYTGLFEAVASVVRDPEAADFEAVVAEHFERVQQELPGF